jgi:hypothetical protein
MIAFAAAFGLLACAQPRSAAVTAPTAGPAPSAASVAPDAASVPPVAAAEPPPAMDSGAEEAPDSGALAQFRACTLDSDCVAVDRVGCCHNGWKEAVASSQAPAYEKSFTCPQAHPMCPMYIVRDARVPLCDNGAHLCTMTRPEDVACGGFIRNKHTCPTGLHCQLAKHPDIPGKCVP